MTKKNRNANKIVLAMAISAVAIIAVFLVIPSLKSAWHNLSLSDIAGTETQRPTKNSSIKETSELPAEPAKSPIKDQPVANSSSKPASEPTRIDELRQYALVKINKDRAKFGLSPVLLSDNQAAQVHSEDVFQTKQISHWMTNGEKPYMTYSRLGGKGYVGQNVAVEGYGQNDAIACQNGFAMCNPINAKEAIDKAEYDMMYNDKQCCNDGHRNNILDKNHTHVSIGIAYDKYYFAFVENFENQYITWNQPITYDKASGKISMRGTSAEGTNFDNINIFYDPFPTTKEYQLHKDDTSYSLGDIAGVVVRPAPIGSYYEKTTQYTLIEADRWSTNGQDFDISFDTANMVKEHGPGVFTVVIVANDKDRNSLDATSTALFLS